MFNKTSKAKFAVLKFEKKVKDHHIVIYRIPLFC